MSTKMAMGGGVAPTATGWGWEMAPTTIRHVAVNSSGGVYLAYEATDTHVAYYDDDETKNWEKSIASFSIENIYAHSDGSVILLGSTSNRPNIIKLSTSGTITYQKYLSGTTFMQTRGIIEASDGALVISYGEASTNMGIVKFSESDFTEDWDTYFANPSSIEGNLCEDSAGNFYVGSWVSATAERAQVIQLTSAGAYNDALYIYDSGLSTDSYIVAGGLFDIDSTYLGAVTSNQDHCYFSKITKSTMTVSSTVALKDTGAGSVSVQNNATDSEFYLIAKHGTDGGVVGVVAYDYDGTELRYKSFQVASTSATLFLTGSAFANGKIYMGVRDGNNSYNLLKMDPTLDYSSCDLDDVSVSSVELPTASNAVSSTGMTETTGTDISTISNTSLSLGTSTNISIVASVDLLGF